MISALGQVGLALIALGALFVVGLLIKAHADSCVSEARAEAFRNGYQCGRDVGVWVGSDHNVVPRKRPPLLPLDNWESTEQAARKEKRQ